MPEQHVPIVTPARVVAGICLLAPFVAVLGVPLYDHGSPEVAGFPFFFWWQLLWVGVTAGLMGLAYVVVRRDEARRETASAARPGAGPDDDSADSADERGRA